MSPIRVHSRHRRGPMILALALLTAVPSGCSRPSGSAEINSSAPTFESSATPVVIVQPQRRALRYTVAQPGRIQAFEQTPVFAKIAGYVQTWNVDIGDHVKKGDTLAELFVPEMVEELKQKGEAVKQAREAFEIARARVATATAQVQEALAGLQRAEANYQRWKLEYERIAKLAGTVLDKQTRDETWNQYQSAAAGWKEAEAKVESAKATVKESEAVRNKAEVDIGAAEAERGRMAALLSYAKLPSPLDGVVTRRHINTGDFVQPATTGKGDPLYVVERRDIMRVFVEVPEADAVWVGKGAGARVRIPVLQGQEFVSQVVRTSYALDRTAHTLLTEIDLPNPEDRLRPGMYAYTTITSERSNVLTVPASAIVTQGDVTQGYQTICYFVRDGKAWRTPVMVGGRDAQFVEVLKWLTPGSSPNWTAFAGSEPIVAQAGGLIDGQPVQSDLSKK